MSRIPYPTDEELEPEVREVIDAMPPLNIVRMFAGAPATLRPLTELGKAVLLEAELDPQLRQAAILTVARVTDSEYERVQHENVARLVGMSDAEIQATRIGDYQQLSAEAALVSRFAEEIARDVQATRETTDRVLELLGRRQATELIVCCAYYCAVARIIATCGVEVEEAPPTAEFTTDDIDADRWTIN
jgi:alkylhydroperoxidase family enzyme